VRIAPSWLLIALLIAAETPVRADPPEEKPLPGERVGGHGRDVRVGKRLDSRVPSRIDSRVRPRTIGRPLVAATSPLTSDVDNGCARDTGSSTTPAASDEPSAAACQSPQ